MNMTMRSHVLFWLPLLFLLVAASRCSGLRPDTGMSAMAAGDKTALMDGCGQQLQDGLMVCRKSEGPVGNDAIYLVAPPSNCKEPPCVAWKIFFPDGSPSIGGVFPEGLTRLPVLWLKLLKTTSFNKDQGGFWGLRYWIRWSDQDGNEQTTILDGDIYLIVHDKAYISLHSVEDDPNFVWSMTDGVNVKMTTGGRVYVEKRK